MCLCKKKLKKYYFDIFPREKQHLPQSQTRSFESIISIVSKRGYFHGSFDIDHLITISRSSKYLVVLFSQTFNMTRPVFEAQELVCG
jgi:hypothetical protein